MSIATFVNNRDHHARKKSDLYDTRKINLEKRDFHSTLLTSHMKSQWQQANRLFFPRRLLSKVLNSSARPESTYHALVIFVEPWAPQCAKQTDTHELQDYEHGAHLPYSYPIGNPIDKSPDTVKHADSSSS